MSGVDSLPTITAARRPIFGRLTRTFLEESTTLSGLIVWVGITIVLIFILISALAPWIAPYDPLTKAGEIGQPPSSSFPFGTDKLGHDIWSRIVWGSRIPLLVIGFSTILSLGMGLPIGLISGYIGGKIDRVLVMVMDSIYAFPGLLLAIVVAAIIGPGVTNISLAIAVVYIPTYFRVIRNHVASVKESLFVEASVALGIPTRGILSRYVFPNVAQNIPVLFSINAADAVLTEAGLTFLGLGILPGTPDWGFDISNHWPLLREMWWATVFPGIMILILTTALALVGEGLNDILNPLLRKKQA